MSLETLHGGCHCGRVRFHVEVDLTSETVLDCTCSICHKKAFLHLIVEPEHFTLDQGNEAMATYTFGSHTARHRFCRTCGVHPFYRPRSHPNAYDINVRCLDEDILHRVPVEVFDGQEWEANVAERWG